MAGRNSRNTLKAIFLSLYFLLFISIAQLGLTIHLYVVGVVDSTLTPSVVLGIIGVGDSVFGSGSEGLK